MKLSGIDGHVVPMKDSGEFMSNSNYPISNIRFWGCNTLPYQVQCNTSVGIPTLPSPLESTSFSEAISSFSEDLSQDLQPPFWKLLIASPILCLQSSQPAQFHIFWYAVIVYIYMFEDQRTQEASVSLLWLIRGGLLICQAINFEGGKMKWDHKAKKWGYWPQLLDSKQYQNYVKDLFCKFWHYLMAEGIDFYF